MHLRLTGYTKVLSLSVTQFSSLAEICCSMTFWDWVMSWPFYARNKTFKVIWNFNLSISSLDDPVATSSWWFGYNSCPTVWFHLNLLELPIGSNDVKYIQQNSKITKKALLRDHVRMTVTICCPVTPIAGVSTPMEGLPSLPSVITLQRKNGHIIPR